jgi:hypothetical protein
VNTGALARALAVLLLTDVVVGVGRTTRYALQHDPFGGGSVAVWAWLLAPVCGAIVGALTTAFDRPRGKLGRATVIAFGAVGGELVAFATYVVVLNRVSCVNVYDRSDDCGFGLAIGMGIGSVLLLALLISIGALLFAIGWILRRWG